LCGRGTDLRRGHAVPDEIILQTWIIRHVIQGFDLGQAVSEPNGLYDRQDYFLFHPDLTPAVTFVLIVPTRVFFLKTSIFKRL